MLLTNVGVFVHLEINLQGVACRAWKSTRRWQSSQCCWNSISGSCLSSFIWQHQCSYQTSAYVSNFTNFTSPFSFSFWSLPARTDPSRIELLKPVTKSETVLLLLVYEYNKKIGVMTETNSSCQLNFCATWNSSAMSPVYYLTYLFTASENMVGNWGHIIRRLTVDGMEGQGLFISEDLWVRKFSCAISLLCFILLVVRLHRREHVEGCALSISIMVYVLSVRLLDSLRPPVSRISERENWLSLKMSEQTHWDEWPSRLVSVQIRNELFYIFSL